MNAVLNRAVFEKTHFDSGRIGVLESLVHSPKRAGQYRLVVLADGTPVLSTELHVHAEAPDSVAYIDLTALKSGATEANNVNCDCDPSPPQRLQVKPGGHLVAHASRGEGLGLAIEQDGHASFAGKFDSQRLEAGDIYALSLLRPGSYVIHNALNGSRGQIVVTTPPQGTRPSQLETVYVDVTERFHGKITVIQTQGLVFRVGTPSRLIIDLEKDHTGQLQRDPSEPLRRLAVLPRRAST